MKIGTKLALAFLTLALTIGAVGYVSLALLQEASLKTIGRDLNDQVAARMDTIQRQVADRLDDLRCFASMKTLARQAAESGAAFDRIHDVEQHIATIDAAWQAGETTPQIDEIVESDLSVELREYTEYLRRESGFDVFPEMYVTNKYGVIIASTGRTTDYLQADDSWYAEAVAADRGSVSHVHYDASSKSLAVDVVVPLRDNGEFAGIVKGMLNIQDLIRTVQFMQSRSHYTTARAYLVDKSGRSVLDKPQLNVGDLDRDLGLEAFGEDLSARPWISAALDQNHGNLVFDDNGVEKLAVFSRSTGSHAAMLPAWTLVMEYDTSEVLRDIVRAKHLLLLASLVVTLVAGLGGLALARSISAPINELTETAARLAGISVDEKTNGHRVNELTALTQTFERMTRTLRGREEELRKEKETLDKIISLNPYSISVFDKDGHILRWNQAFIDLFKQPPPKEYSFFEDPIAKEQGQQEGLLGLKKGKIYEAPANWYNTNRIDPTLPDNPVCVRVVFFPIMDDADQLQWVVALSEDVTQRKRAEEVLLKEHRSLRNLLDASDRERQLIAYEIHDGVAQHLTAAKMQFEAFDHLLQVDSESARKAHDAAAAMLGSAIAETRRLISGLRPPIIDEMGIVSAIEHLAGDMEAREGIRVDFCPNVDF
ncbi:MAG TPA: histidine kinase, partial [Thermoguttaceae bacterium]|nr:histidine kinase [Thermoguttaceae bacterium]